MFRRISKGRAAAVVVVLALALAVPSGAAGGRSELADWAAWQWLLDLVECWTTSAKDGPCGHPDGGDCTGLWAPAGERAPSSAATKDGPCVHPDGRPQCGGG